MVAADQSTSNAFGHPDSHQNAFGEHDGGFAPLPPSVSHRPCAPTAGVYAALMRNSLLARDAPAAMRAFEMAV